MGSKGQSHTHIIENVLFPHYNWVYICTYQYELSKNVPHGSRIPSFLFGVKRIKVKVIDYTWIWFRWYFYIICYSYSCSLINVITHPEMCWVSWAIAIKYEWYLQFCLEIGTLPNDGFSVYMSWLSLRFAPNIFTSNVTAIHTLSINVITHPEMSWV